MKIIRISLFSLYTCSAMVFLIGCSSLPDTALPVNRPSGIVLGASDPLPSWSKGQTKQTIVSFVQRVTTPGNPDFVEPDDRIATFDNDGCLWAEKPMYFQLAFIFERVQELASEHPEWKTTQPFQAVLERDMETLGQMHTPDLLKLAMATHTGMTQSEYESIAAEFLATARHPRFEVLYKELVYQPQLELLDYLRDHGFQTFICSGGGIDFIRGYSQEAYGIPPAKVIGSTVDIEFELRDGRSTLVRKPAVHRVNDKAGKPIGIQRHIGRRPLIAVGNSDGDIEMMQFADGRDGPSLCLLLHHDDADREYDYDKGTEKALKVAASRNWTVISIKNDFERVFPFSK